MLEVDLKLFGEKLYNLYKNDPGKLSVEQSPNAIWQSVVGLTPTKISNKASGENIAATRTQINSPTLDAASVAIQELHKSQGIGSISITLVGETHRNEEDTERGNELIEQIEEKKLTPTYVIIERGLKYQAPYENGLLESQFYMAYLGQDFSTAFNIKQRSMVTAAYLLLCLAGGDQKAIDKVVLFLGEEHKDIFDYFEKYCQSLDWVYKRPRTYLLIPSHVK